MTEVISNINQAYDFLDKYKKAIHKKIKIRALERADEILAVPFILDVNMHSINEDCEHIFFDKINGLKEEVFYCGYEDHKIQYALTGSKIINCKNCPLNKR
jgi:hypothetical protein